MISEASCDTEDWSNDAENIKNIKMQYFNILQQYFKKQFDCFLIK